MRSSPYDERFYKVLSTSGGISAKEIVPVIMEYVRPSSVVDLGCGTGAWLAEFRRLGAKEILGIDGSWVNVNHLLIPKDCFRQANLQELESVGERFDLAVSLEVAEHLPESLAQQFVTALVSLSDIVVFSAAIPHQGGVGHVNEQWQSYWADLFEKQGYVPVDCIRPRIWTNPNLAYMWFRAQNTLLYVNKKALPKYPALLEASKVTHKSLLNIVHPEVYLGQVRLANVLRKIAFPLKLFPIPFRESVRRCLFSLFREKK